MESSSCRWKCNLYFHVTETVIVFFSNYTVILTAVTTNGSKNRQACSADGTIIIIVYREFQILHIILRFLYYAIYYTSFVSINSSVNLISIYPWRESLIKNTVYYNFFNFQRVAKIVLKIIFFSLKLKIITGFLVSSHLFYFIGRYFIIFYIYI